MSVIVQFMTKVDLTFSSSIWAARRKEWWHHLQTNSGAAPQTANNETSPWTLWQHLFWFHWKTRTLSDSYSRWKLLLEMKGFSDWTSENKHSWCPQHQSTMLIINHLFKAKPCGFQQRSTVSCLSIDLVSCSEQLKLFNINSEIEKFKSFGYFSI